MKKLFLLLIPASLAIFASCSKSFDAVAEEESQTKLVEFSLIANAPICEAVEEETKGEMRLVGRMFWYSTDKISVINVTQETYLGDLDIQGVTTKTETATFEGTISSGMNPGDKLAFVYPALEGCTIGSSFTSYEQSVANQVYDLQNQSVEFCAYATGTAPSTGDVVSIGTVDFTTATGFIHVNIVDAPINAQMISKVSVSDINNAFTWKIEGGKLVISAPEKTNEGVVVDIIGATSAYAATNNLSVKVSFPVSPENPGGRKFYINSISANGGLNAIYSVEYDGKAYKNNIWYNRIVKGYQSEIEGIQIDDATNVAFAHGNLKWDSNNGYGFEEEQYSYPTNCDNYVGHFYWSETVEMAAAASYTSPAAGHENNFFASNLEIDGISWKTLTSDQWQYVKEHNRIVPGVEINGQPNCIVIAPSTYSKEIDEEYTSGQWEIAEAQGLVCLPAAGYRDKSAKVKGCVYDLRYWSSTSATGDSKGAKAFYVYRGSLVDDPISSTYCYLAAPIRLVTAL